MTSLLVSIVLPQLVKEPGHQVLNRPHGLNAKPRQVSKDEVANRRSEELSP